MSVEQKLYEYIYDNYNLNIGAKFVWNIIWFILRDPNPYIIPYSEEETADMLLELLDGLGIEKREIMDILEEGEN